MADISRVSRLLTGLQRGIDFATNTLIVDNLKIRMGSGSDTNVATFSGTLTATRTISMPNTNVDLGLIAANTADIADLRTLTGTVDGDTHLGTFSGTTIPDSSTVKGALQSLETAHEAHLNGGASKHDATEVDYERADGSKKDIQAASDDVETALTDLDDNKISKTGSIAFTGNQSMGSNKITNLADPTSAQDAATKAYVDASLDGRKWKQSVRVATTANITLATAPAAIDGVTLSNGDRVLVKDQTTGSENGIYVFNGAGSAMTRASDADTSAEVDGMAVSVTQGSTQADYQYFQTADNITLGTTALAFVVIGSNAFSGHDMITLTGNQISVDLASDAGLESTNAGNAAGQLRVKPDATGGANLARSINRSANGLAVKIDDTTIGEGASQRLEVKNDGISGLKIRLANDQYLRGRNAANSADVNIIKVNSSNELELGARLNGDLAYTPAVLSNWNSSADPGDTDDALDQLASRVKTIETETAYTETLQDQFVAGNTLPTGLRALRFTKAADSLTLGRVIVADTDATTVDNFNAVCLFVAAAETAGTTIVVTKAGKMTVTGHGLTVGEPIYLGASGVITQTPPSTANHAVVFLGMVKDANTLEVSIQARGVN